MPIESNCPNCGKTLRVDEAFAGHKARCPMCDSIYDVPTQSDSAQLNSAFSSLDTNPVFPTQSKIDVDLNRDTNSRPSVEGFPNHPTLSPLDSYANENPSVLNSRMHSSPETNAVQDAAAFYVKVPSGQTYGPVDEQTLRQWAAQGRVNHTCMVNPINTEFWITYSAWLGYRVQSQNQKNSKPREEYIFGDSLAKPMLPANQSVQKNSGGGILVLVLGLASWVLCFSAIGAPVLAIVALVLGFKELGKIERGLSAPSERVPAIIGMVSASLNLFVSVGLFILIIVLATLN